MTSVRGLMAGTISGLLALVLGDQFRLTPGTLTLISLVFGFVTAVVVAIITARGSHTSDEGDLGHWAVQRLGELEAENKELGDRCSRLAIENAWLREKLAADDGTAPASGG